MASKYIKNNTGGDKTYVGQVIGTGEYYLIQPIEMSKWSNDSSLLTDIGSGDAIIAKSDSGTDDITDVNLAINYLKDSAATHIANPFPDNESGYSFRGKGGTSALTAGVNNVDELLSATDTRIINGAEVWTDSGNHGDHLQFQVYDKDGAGVALGLYTQATYDAMTDAQKVLEEFGDCWQIHGSSVTKAFPGYIAKVYPGLYIRMKVTAAANCNFYYNIHRHKQ